RQVGAGRSARLAAAHATVALCRAPPGTVVLVDDVHTTGATLEACARVLRNGGAQRVVALAYARTVRG
ncbi:MAG TPA: phosphoribosyltransferase family protein, partial [Solirubrobacteraceae bacterium]|nr:phosphoribosyltransferase family protein [Solirubrobacteraceae bacterium]